MVGESLARNGGFPDSGRNPLTSRKYLICMCLRLTRRYEPRSYHPCELNYTKREQRDFVPPTFPPRGMGEMKESGGTDSKRIDTPFFSKHLVTFPLSFSRLMVRFLLQISTRDLEKWIDPRAACN